MATTIGRFSIWSALAVTHHRRGGRDNCARHIASAGAVYSDCPATCRLPTAADCRLPTADCRLPTATVDCRLTTADWYYLTLCPCFGGSRDDKPVAATQNWVSGGNDGRPSAGAPEAGAVASLTAALDGLALPEEEIEIEREMLDGLVQVSQPARCPGSPGAAPGRDRASRSRYGSLSLQRPVLDAGRCGATERTAHLHGRAGDLCRRGASADTPLAHRGRRRAA